MSATVGEAVVKLSFDDKNASKQIDGFGSKVGSIAKGIGKALTAAFAAGTTAVIAFAKTSVDEFNEERKALAKLQQVAENQNWSETAVDSLKTYNSELQRTGILGDEIYSAGQAQLGTFALSEKAVKTLTPAMGDLIAATSGFEASTESATSMANLLGKVMTGSTSALTRYGVTLDANQKKLLEEGDEMTRAATLVDILKNNYGGFNKALAETPQGKVKQLSNSFSDLKESFGAFIAGEGDLTGFFENLNTFVNDIISLVTTMAPQVIEGLVSLVQQIAAQLPTIIQTVAPVLAQALVDLTIAFVEALPSFLDALLTLVLQIADALIQNIDIILNAVTDVFIGVIEKLTAPDTLQQLFDAGLTLFLKLVDTLPDILIALLDAFPTVINGIISFLTSPDTINKLMKAAVKLFLALVMAVPQILGSLIGAFGNLVGGLWNGITNLFSKFAADFGNFIGNIFKGAINGIIGFIEGFINTPIDILNGFIGIINGAFGWIGVNLGYINRISLPRLAQGGYADGATAAIIGEEGKEAVLPLEHNTDNWAGLLASTLVEEMGERGKSGSTINVYMTNEINNELDANEIGRLMMESIRRAA